jgi:hypothetical protein
MQILLRCSLPFLLGMSRSGTREWGADTRFDSYLSVAAKIEVTVTSILAAGKLSNLGDIESTPLIFDITGHFVRDIEFWLRKSGGPFSPSWHRFYQEIISP